MAQVTIRTMYGANIGAQVSPPNGNSITSSSDYPTIDRLDASLDTVIDPLINVTLVGNSDEEVAVTLTLANGTTDGFLKTIRCGNGVEWTITPANMSDGATIVIDASEGNGPGAVTLVWDATLVEWDVVSLYNGVVP